jgi:HAD superfamily hydrolase (TIGR01549 family)
MRPNLKLKSASMETFKALNRAEPTDDLTAIKVVAFDCDGVMFNSEKANQAYYNQILDHFDFPGMTPKQFAYAHMHTVDESLAHLFTDPRALAAAQQYRRQMKYLPFVKYMEIEPYLKDLLARLKHRYKIAIATNRTDTMPHVIAEHGLEGLFDLVVTALDVTQPKPHPEQLHKIMDFFRIAPENVRYIGDSEVDAVAAAEAGIRLVAYGNRSLEAAFHIDNLREVGSILKL